MQMILGYDEKSELLLQPIQAGQSLPKEALEYYEEYCSHLKGESRSARGCCSCSSTSAAVERACWFERHLLCLLCRPG